MDESNFVQDVLSDVRYYVKKKDRPSEVYLYGSCIRMLHLEKNTKTNSRVQQGITSMFQ